MSSRSVKILAATAIAISLSLPACGTADRERADRAEAAAARAEAAAARAEAAAAKTQQAADQTTAAANKAAAAASDAVRSVNAASDHVDELIAERNAREKHSAHRKANPAAAPKSASSSDVGKTAASGSDASSSH